MGKFSGILICSDFDGTLAWGGVIPQSNIDAIKYFRENGGAFSLITGRNVSFVKDFREALSLDSYVGCLNGTVIYDMARERVAVSDYIEGDVYTPTVNIRKSLKNLRNVVVFGDGDTVTVQADSESFESELLSACSRPINKILIRNGLSLNAEEIAFIKNAFGGSYAIARSWDRGIEIQNARCDKGGAARRMAELEGADTLICVGDYENDIPMLNAADVAYAVDNAIAEVKNAAHRLTVSAENGAIAAIIAELDRN